MSVFFPDGSGPTVEEGPTTAENTERVLARAETNAQQILATQGVSDVQRREAESVLQQVEVARGADQSALDRLSPALQGLFSAFAVPNQILGGIAGVANETADLFRENESFSLNDLFEDVTGLEADNRSFLEKALIGAQFLSPAPLTFEDGVRFERRDISLQGTFADVVRDIPGDNTVGAAVKGVLGFGLDVGLDPTTYLGGLGLLTNTAETGIRQGGRRLVVNGVNRKVLANEFLEESARLSDLGTVAGRSRARQLADIARNVQRFGPNRARRSFDDETNDLLSEYVFTGITARVPFRRIQARVRGVDRDQIPQAVRIPGTDTGVAGAALRNVRAAGDFLAEPLLRVTPSQRRTARSAQGTTDDFIRTYEAETIFQRAHVGSSVWLGTQIGRLTEVLPGIELNKDQISRSSRAQLERLNQPEVGQALREAVERGQTTGRITVEGGESIDLEWFTGFLSDLHTDLTSRGIALGNVESFFPRMLRQNTELVDDARVFRQATQSERQSLIRRRKWAPGSVLGFHPEDGSALILKDGSIEEVEAIFNLLGENFQNPFRDDVVGLMYDYLKGAADLVKRARVDQELTIHGLKSSRDHFNGRSTVRFLQNTRQLRQFDDSETQRIFDKLLGNDDGRGAAIRYTDEDVPGRIVSLRQRRSRLRDEALGNIGIRQTFEDQLRVSREGVREAGGATRQQRRRSRDLIRTIDDSVRLEENVLRIETQLEEIQETIRIVSGDDVDISPAAIRRARGIEESLNERLAIAQSAQEVAGEAHNLILRDLPDAAREYREAGRELARINATDVRKFDDAGSAFVSRLINDLGLTKRALSSKSKRLKLIEENTVRGDVLARITNGNLEDMVQIIDDEVGRGVITAAEAAHIRPAIETMRDLVRFDAVSIKSIQAAPAQVPARFRARSEELLMQSDRTSDANRTRKDHLFQGSRFMDTAARIMEEANDLQRRLDDFPDDTPPETLTGYNNAIKARQIYAQEMASHAELTAMGTPFSGERLLRQIESIDDDQWQQIANNMYREAESLIPIKGSADLAATQEIAEMLNWRADMSDFSRSSFGQAARNLRLFFSPQALLTPGFSFRNHVSAQHMNAIVGGLTDPADYAKYRDMLIGVRRSRMGVEEPFEGLNLNQREIDIAETLYEFFDDNQGRLADRLDRVTNTTPRTLGGERIDRATDRFFIGIDNASQIMDRSTAAFFTQRGRIRGVAPTRGTIGRDAIDAAEDYGVEEFNRFALGAHSMVQNNLSARSAVDVITKAHFDYADLSTWDRTLRDVGFPFWTFMSRNLPLQVEMLAKRPGAYNNLIAWQEQTYSRNDEGGRRPSFHNTELHFTIPEDVWLLGGDALTPDLAFNDLISRVDNIGELAGLRFDENGLANVGGTNPLAGLRVMLGESSPWTKIWYELAAGEDTFTGRDLTRFEEPFSNSIPGVGGAVTEVLGAILPDAWARRDPVNGDINNREWRFEGRANQVVRQFSPILARLERLNPSGDSRYQDRQIASWISFMAGGVRKTGDNDFLISAYELSDRAQSILRELDAYAVPSAGELGGRSDPFGR